MRCVSRPWVFLLVLCAATGTTQLASAGQLIVDWYGLKEARDDGAAVVLGTVTTIEQSGKPIRVTITVTQVFAAPNGDKGPGKGESFTRDLYLGPEWTDPHKSPMDRRLRGGLRAAPPEGKEVALVGGQGSTEVLLVEPPLLRTLAILYAPNPAAAIAKSNVDQLTGDLANPDLADLARVELGKRGKLNGKALLRGDERWVEAHVRALPAAKRAALLRELLPVTKTDRALRLTAATLFFAELTPETIALTAQLAGQLDPKNQDEARLLDSLRVPLLTAAQGDAEARAVDLSPFEAYLFATTIARPDHRVSDDDLEKLLARCSRAVRARLAARFLGAIYATNRAKDDDFDDFVLGTAVELAKSAPSAALWEPLSKLDPNRPRVHSEKRALLESMIQIGAALVQHDAKLRTKVRDLLEPHVNGELEPAEEWKTLFKKQIGEPPRGPARAATFVLRPGQMHRLPSGDRVSMKRDAASGDYEIELVEPNGSGRSQFLQAGKDWYREWYFEPYLVIVRSAGDGVKLSLTPVKKDPEIDPSDAFDLAKKICDERGATGEVDQDNQDQDGIFTYTVKAPKPCVVRVGKRTKKILPPLTKPYP